MDSYKNFAYTTVATPPIDISDTSLSIQSGTASLFPTPPYNLTVWKPDELPLINTAEIVRVTNAVSDNLTIVRAQEGTTAKSIQTGWKVAQTVTVKTLADIKTYIDGKPFMTPSGSTGQVLAKNSNTNYDTVWIDPPSTTNGYTLQNTDKTSTYVYVGYSHTDGRWYIYRRIIASNTRQYATGASSYATNWTNRGSQTYV